MEFLSNKTACMVILLLLPPLVEAADLYLYEDEHGHKVWGNSVPAHLIDNGYSVHSNGRLVSEIPRALSAAEEIEQAQELALQAQEAKLQERQQQFDNLLLRRYSSLNDYEDRSGLALKALFDRKEQIDERLNDTNSDIEGLDQEIQKTKNNNGKPTAVQLSQLENLNVVRLRIMKQLLQTDEEIQQHQSQSKLERHRLSQLLVNK